MSENTVKTSTYDGLISGYASHRRLIDQLKQVVYLTAPAEYLIPWGQLKSYPVPHRNIHD